MDGGAFNEALTDDAWRWLYREAARQSLLGVCWVPTDAMPKDLALQWAAEAESIRGLNLLLNDEAARLTRLFADKSRKTAVLKGQANARLYPDKLARQPGDIDLWVEGGYKSVVELLKNMKLIDGIGMAGGNFGRYSGRRQQNVFRRVWAGRVRNLKMMRFDFWEMLWVELNFWKVVVQTLPERIRRRSWSLAEANKRDGIG